VCYSLWYNVPTMLSATGLIVVVVYIFTHYSTNKGENIIKEQR